MSELINGRTAEIVKSGLANMLESCGDMCGESTRCLQGLCPYYGDDYCEESILKGALALIERLEAERDAALAKVPKWISVEERLPEEGKPVLIRLKHKDGSVSYEVAKRGEDKPLGWHMTEEYKNRSLNNPRITHWMPLKEPEEDAHG